MAWNEAQAFQASMEAECLTPRKNKHPITNEQNKDTSRMNNTHTIWTTVYARGMGPTYHHLKGLTRKEILLECTRDEALLISAAPDLLSALQSALDDSPNWQEAARTAIVKATTESQRF